MEDFLQYVTKMSVLLVRIIMSTIRRNGHVSSEAEKIYNVRQEFNGVQTIIMIRNFLMFNNMHLA